MGATFKKNIQLVISHIEGSSGNFLARLYTGNDLKNQPPVRVDINHDPFALAINGRDTWYEELTRLTDHTVVITHNFDQIQIIKTFPTAQIIQIYPYTKIGNVLYNISHKKLKLTLDNYIDNNLIQIKEWYKHIISHRPTYQVTDFGNLNHYAFVENLLGIKFNSEQTDYFDRYWAKQLPYNLSIPDHPMSIANMIKLWNIENWFNEWSVAYVIFVYELLHGYQDNNRLWSIDAEKFVSWQDVESLTRRYQLI